MGNLGKNYLISRKFSHFLQVSVGFVPKPHFVLTNKLFPLIEYQASTEAA